MSNAAKITVGKSDARIYHVIDYHWLALSSILYDDILCMLPGLSILSESTQVCQWVLFFFNIQIWKEPKCGVVILMSSGIFWS